LHRDFDVGVVFEVAVAFDVVVGFDLPRIETLPNPARVSRELWEDMFEPKASWSSHPADTRRIWGPDRREGNGFAVAFFLVTFSWRSKKK